MDGRRERGIEIAKQYRIRQTPRGWIVPSQSGAGKYAVVMGESPSCTCPDFEARGVRCKHIFAVEIVIKREYVDDGEVQTLTETLTVKKTYSQDWPAYNKAQTVEKDEFQKLLHELCGNIEAPVQTFGRPRLPLADIIFAAALALGIVSVVLVAQQRGAMTQAQKDKRWEVENELQAIAVVDRKIMMPMRDGVRLAGGGYVAVRRGGRGSPQVRDASDGSEPGTAGPDCACPAAAHRPLGRVRGLLCWGAVHGLNHEAER